MSRVYVRFPRTGLGNMMLVWARGAVFAQLNQLPLIASPWWGIRWGAWKRNEKKKRLYWGYFKESSIVARLGIVGCRFINPVMTEPSLQKLAPGEVNGKLFVFKQVVVQNDLFEGLRDHRVWIKEQFLQLLNPSLKRRLHAYDSPGIAVHIRRGDFKFGNPLTPLNFYVTCINQVRAALSNCLQVTVFTDAEMQEIADVLALPNVKLAEEKPDILDILLMSRARVIILSQSSTFSYWAAFLSEAIIIRPSTDWQKAIRCRDDRRELLVDPNGEDAKQNLVNKLRHIVA